MEATLQRTAPGMCLTHAPSRDPPSRGRSRRKSVVNHPRSRRRADPGAPPPPASRTQPVPGDRVRTSPARMEPSPEHPAAFDNRRVWLHYMEACTYVPD
jgi:hypothetical protein